LARGLLSQLRVYYKNVNNLDGNVYHLLLLFHLGLANLPTITVVVLCCKKVGRLLATRRQSVRSSFRIPVGLRDFSLLQKHPDRPWGLPFSCSVGIGVLSRGWTDRGVKLTTYLSSAEFKIECSFISSHSVCFHAWTGKEPAAINSIFAHAAGQISNVSNASYCIVRTRCGVHCMVFLQMIPATFRNI
jgi:hypothetical protein